MGAALVFALVPVIAAALSGAVAAVRPPGERTSSGLQHFAAGILFAAAAIELLPGVVLQRSPLVAVGGVQAAGHRGLPIGLGVGSRSTSSSTA